VENRTHPHALQRNSLKWPRESFANLVNELTQNLNLSQSFINKFLDDLSIHECNESLLINVGNKFFIIPFWTKNLRHIQIILNRHIRLRSSFESQINIQNKISSTRLQKLIQHHKQISLNKKIHQFNQAILDASIEDVPKKILNLPIFKCYASCHIFLHDKGSSFAEGYHYSNTSNSTYNNYTTTTFNLLFNNIKKSKNKSFSIDSSSIHNLPFTGTYLGKNYTTRLFNLIIIISRNDFLPPLKTEIDLFDKYTRKLPRYINNLAIKAKIKLETKQIINTLNNLPIQIIVKHDDNITYDNFSLQDKSSKNLIHEGHIAPARSVQIFAPDLTDDIFTNLMHHERVSLLGELLNTLKHELSNPLFGIKLTADLADLTELAEQDKTIFNEIKNSIKRSQLIIENFSSLYNSSNNNVVIDVTKITHEVLTLTKSQLKLIDVQVQSSSEKISLKSNPTYLLQIFFNLIINSAQALNSSLIVPKKLVISIISDENEIIIDFIDNGPGIEKDKAQNIFKPFYTTKPQGTGLGLAIASKLARAINASLEYIDTTEGAHFRLRLNHENIDH
jgi:signal transduction histidine kinase